MPATSIPAGRKSAAWQWWADFGVYFILVSLFGLLRDSLDNIIHQPVPHGDNMLAMRIDRLALVQLGLDAASEMRAVAAA